MQACFYVAKTERGTDGGDVGKARWRFVLTSYNCECKHSFACVSSLLFSSL